MPGFPGGPEALRCGAARFHPVGVCATGPAPTISYAENYVGCTSVSILEEDAHLVLRSPLGPTHVLLWQGGESFLSRADPEVRVTFELEGERVVAFVLSEHGARQRARRLY